MVCGRLWCVWSVEAIFEETRYSTSVSYRLAYSGVYSNYFAHGSYLVPKFFAKPRRRPHYLLYQVVYLSTATVLVVTSMRTVPHPPPTVLILSSSFFFRYSC